ncbi:MAG TPA: TolC family protein, partial [Verrucomicrobiae bacterium]|nr:TolC family protein [Verrucomicrobiae bacterium]
MIFGRLIATSLLLAICCGAQTSYDTARFLTLRQAIDAALLNNRTLQIERINPEIARMTLRASLGYYDPVLLSQARKESITELAAFDPANPGLESGFMTESDVVSGGITGFLPSGLSYNVSGNYGHSTGSRNFLNFDSYRIGASIYLQQPLLKNFWIDLPRYTIRVNKRNLQISEAGVHFLAMDIINLTQQAYYYLVFAWENLRVQHDLLTTRQNFLRGIQRQVELGSLTVLEERVAASQHAGVQTLLIAGSNTVALAANNLRTLMGVTGTNWTQEFYVPVDRLPLLSESLDLATSWQRGLARRPDLLQLTKGVENADLSVKFRRNQLLPSLDLIGAYGRRGASSIQAFPPDQPRASFPEAVGQLQRGDAPSDMIGVVLSFPLTRALERANYRASKELKKQAELLVKQREELVLREISDAMHTVRYSYDRVHAAERAKGFAEAALRAEEEKL